MDVVSGVRYEGDGCWRCIVMTVKFICRVSGVFSDGVSCRQRVWRVVVTTSMPRALQSPDNETVIVSVV